MTDTAPPPLTAAVVGCGRMGTNQARILSRMPDYELVALGDIDRAGAVAAADAAGGGAWVPGIDEGMFEPVPAPEGQAGAWRAVEWEDDGVHAVEKGLRGMARMLREGGTHPMAGDVALRGFEVLMAVYESARLHRKLALPLEQDRFPLDLMLEDGQL